MRLGRTHWLATSLLFISLSSLAQAPSPRRDLLASYPQDRIRVTIDDEDRVSLRGNVHPLARATNDIGIAPPNLRMDKMILLLTPDASQQAALDQLVFEQHDPQSPHFHQWLSPEDYGRRFGVSDRDLQQIASWLEMHGMDIEEVTASRRAIVFSGSVAMAQSAFGTEIHRYSVNGQSHYANASNPQIPRAISAVVGGVMSLHDFRSAPMIAMSSKLAPEFTSGSSHYVTPGDLATIYDVSPLYGQGIDGAGQSIAIVGRSNINLSDVRSFRSAFGLPAKDPQILLAGADPGTSNTSDEVEADLDVQWAGALAKNATVIFAPAASTNSSDGVFLSAQYIVNHNLAPVMSVSFGACEAAFGASGNAFINSLWQQAASQGITVFVSAGDSGAAGCDSASSSSAGYGLGINALCSTPYSVCVGGTEFNEGSNSSFYWSASNSASLTSALSYIPEAAWNESTSGLWSGGGGVSTVYTKPVWQNATGVPADGMRDVPDLSLTAAVHDGYLVYLNGSRILVGGTSAASPSLASIMALAVQNAAARQGMANTVFYPLARLQNSGGAAVFHDITVGNNSVPGLSGFSATTGYDRATGLGSVDATLLVNHWADASLSPSLQVNASTSTASVVPGANTSVTLTSAVSGGFKSAVSFTASGVPAGVTLVFTPSVLPSPGSGSTIAKFTASSTAKSGTYPVTLTATGGSTKKNIPFSFTVLPAPTLTLTTSATSIVVTAGASSTLTLTTAGNSTFNSTVTLSASGLSTGLTASFAPASFSAPGSGTGTLTLTATSNASPGSHSIVVTANGGGIAKSVTVKVNIPGFSLTAAATSLAVVQSAQATVRYTVLTVGGFSSDVTLSTSALPSGVTAAFSSAKISAPGSGVTSLTITAASNAGLGSSIIAVIASGGGITKTVNLALVVKAPPTFTITPAAATLNVYLGSSAQTSISVVGQNGFTSSVTFSASGLPSGTTLTFANSTVSPGARTTIKVSTSANALAGSTPIAITARGGGLTQTATLTLHVLTH